MTNPTAREKTFVCEVAGCNKSYGARGNLRWHQLKHDGKTFACEVAGCNKSFAYEYGLQRHQGAHNLTACSWPGCTKKFARNDNLRRHLQQHEELNSVNGNGQTAPTTLPELERTLLQLFVDLRTREPTHDIFGETARGLVRLPLYPLRDTNGQSWENVCRTIAKWVFNETQSDFELERCWMSRYHEFSIYTQSNGRSVHIKRVNAVRLIAFLANPSALNWAYLTENGFRAIDTPFSHTCGPGRREINGRAAFCINGLYHGRFATKSENESHKWCTHGARPLCPGHGVPPVKCIFTHPDGARKPCLNQEDHVPKCSCARPCF